MPPSWPKIKPRHTLWPYFKFLASFPRSSPTSLRLAFSVTAFFTASIIIPGLLKSLNTYHWPFLVHFRYKKATTKRFTLQACNIDSHPWQIWQRHTGTRASTCTRLEYHGFVIVPRIVSVLSIHAMHIPD